VHGSVDAKLRLTGSDCCRFRSLPEYRGANVTRQCLDTQRYQNRYPKQDKNTHYKALHDYWEQCAVHN
jgi:hypothetical protein